MGLDYYLVRDDNKTLFDLGKWFPIRIFVSRGDYYPDRFKLPDGLNYALEIEFPQLSVSEQYDEELTRRLVRWAGDAELHLVCDASTDIWELKNEGYRETGTRYARRVGDWWVSEIDNVCWDDSTRPATRTLVNSYIYASHVDGRVVLIDVPERDRFARWKLMTEDELETVSCSAPAPGGTIPA